MLFKGQVKNHIDLSQINLRIDGQQIKKVGDGCNNKTFKYVGITLDKPLTWDAHINNHRKKLSSAIFAISRVKNIFPSFLKT